MKCRGTLQISHLLRSTQTALQGFDDTKANIPGLIEALNKKKAITQLMDSIKEADRKNARLAETLDRMFAPSSHLQLPLPANEASDISESIVETTLHSARSPDLVIVQAKKRSLSAT